jgi:hypothetical protein
MQRSKQQALMFLLGAALVGGVLGFSADRVLRHQQFASDYGPRAKMYDDLGLTDGQRNALDSLIADNVCAVKAVQKPVQAQLDSVQKHFREQRQAIFTPQQRALLDARRKDADARRNERLAKEPPRKPCSAN